MSHELERLQPGQRVLFMSGALFGTVGDVHGDLVRIDAGSTSICVSTDAIFTVEGNLVTLVCERRGLADYVIAIEDDQACA
ncbi:MAG TPA: hypothetical protein VIH05_02480 [Tepidiformaceae bacterium]